VPVALPPPRTAAAVEFALEAYVGVKVRPGKGITHAEAVADLVRAAGADETTQVAAILHDVVEDTPLGVDEVRDAFGDRVAAMVAALTEDKTIRRYAQRKRMLRTCIAAAEPAAMDIAVADKIASLRQAAATGSHISPRKLSHYRATLRLAAAAGASTLLLAQLDQLLAGG
jgi:(p)ppGpp synthase/HD superfamily hydrolase